MNKELTPLQALERLTKIHNHDEFNECYSTIETALKRLEELDSIYTLTNHNGKFYVVIDKTEFDQMLKQIKALEIIKKLPQEEKQVLLNTIYTYTKSEEEYDLLKEIL